MSKIGVTIGGRTYTVEINLRELASGTTSPYNEMTVVVDGEPLRVMVPRLGSPEHLEWIVIENRPYELAIDRDLRWIATARGRHELEIRNLETPATRPTSRDGRIKAPIPGLIKRVMVNPGDLVEVGQPLLVLEAMKMENEIRVPRAGVVSQLNVHAGQSVALHEVLAEIMA